MIMNLFKQREKKKYLYIFDEGDEENLQQTTEINRIKKMYIGVKNI
jgi:hypothetical protein